MQIFVHFPMMLTFPQYSSLMIDEIIQIATLDLLSTMTFDNFSEGDVFNLVLSPPDESAEINEGEFKAFQSTGYESRYLIINLGMMYFTFIVMIFMSILTYICRPFEKRSKYIKKKMKNWRESLFWNGYLRLLIEGCLEIFIGVVLNIYISLTASYSNGSILGPWTQ